MDTYVGFISLRPVMSGTGDPLIQRLTGSAGEQPPCLTPKLPAQGGGNCVLPAMVYPSPTFNESARGAELFP